MTIAKEVRKLWSRSFRRSGRRIDEAHTAAQESQLGALKQRVWELGWGETVEIDGLRVRVTDGPNFYMQYKDEFVRRIYHFESTRRRPVIVDGGANIGMSSLYFKHVYPQARIVAFEPDPAIFELLQENVAANGCDGVQLVNAGLGPEAGCFEFDPDSSAGGQITASRSDGGVRVERLSDYLDEQVDFLKLNIEGLELPVLAEAADAGKLGQVQEMVVEYHGWPGQQQRLGELLQLLDRAGFRYMVHDFDSETCPVTKPPFRLQSATTWFCLVYARQQGLISRDG